MPIIDCAEAPFPEPADIGLFQEKLSSPHICNRIQTSPQDDLPPRSDLRRDLPAGLYGAPTDLSVYDHAGASIMEFPLEGMKVLAELYSA